jgi:hypothetical protein
LPASCGAPEGDSQSAAASAALQTDRPPANSFPCELDCLRRIEVQIVFSLVIGTIQQSAIHSITMRIFLTAPLPPGFIIYFDDIWFFLKWTGIVVGLVVAVGVVVEIVNSIVRKLEEAEMSMRRREKMRQWEAEKPERDRIEREDEIKRKAEERRKESAVIGEMVQELKEAIEEMSEAVELCRRHLVNHSYNPFWDSVDSARPKQSNVINIVSQLDYLLSGFRKKWRGDPSYKGQKASDLALDDEATDMEDRLEKIIYSAHRDPKFAVVFAIREREHREYLEKIRQMEEQDSD